MKRIFTLLFVFTMLGSTIAQDLPSAKIPKFNISQKSIEIIEARFRANSKNGITISEWYNHASAFDNLVAGGAVDFSVRFTSFDSNGYIIFTDGRKISIGTQLVGQLFDPKDSTYLGQSPVLSKFNGYKVDSIAFPRFYIRQVDSTIVNSVKVEVVDTMVIQYFNNSNSGIDFNRLQIPVGQNLLGHPSRDFVNYKTLLNSRAIKTERILLRKADADSMFFDATANGFLFTPSVQFLNPNITIAGTNTGRPRTNTFSYTVFFKPMIKVNLGDTIVSVSNTIKPKLVHNFLGFRTGDANGIAQENTTENRYNNSIFTFNFIRYGQLSNNGWKSYITGNAYADGVVWDNNIKITSTNVGVKNTSLTAINVYPNPAANANQVTVEFASTTSSNGTVQLLDLNGKLISSNSLTFKTGDNNATVNVAGLTSGVYFIKLVTETGSISSKLVLTK